MTSQAYVAPPPPPMGSTALVRYFALLIREVKEHQGSYVAINCRGHHTRGITINKVTEGKSQ